MHRAFGLFAHITWHTSRRKRSVHAADVQIVAQSVIDAASRNRVHILAQAILANHVHVLVSVRPDIPVARFVRDAKSESARRVNQTCGRHLKWARGYYAGSLSHSHIPAARVYLAEQLVHHPELLPAE